MLRALFLLLIASVLCCGMLPQPAFAHDEVAHHQAEAGLGDAGESHKGSSDPAHFAHHHCPAALHQHPAALASTHRMKPLLFACAAAPLGSLSHAPPVEPPAA